MAYQQTLSVGTVLIEDFRILGLLGSGGFANTYLALDLTLGREVAIKEYFPSDLAVRAGSDHVHVKSKAQEPQFEWALRRFVREAKTLAKFRHPSVVRVFRVFNANETAYIVLEFVRGSNMESWLKGLGRRPSQDEIDTLLPPLLDALEVVHSAGILHRDIKPANIYIRAADKTPVLLDFGAARYASAGELAGTTAAIVSKGYSPHEAYATDSRLQGPWTDIYGLAATLYRSLTGAAPPESTTRVLEDNCAPMVTMAGVAGDYRPEFLAAIDFGLRIMPKDRPQAIGEWRRMLLPDAASMPRLLDANGDPTTVQEWRPISDMPSDAPTAERGWSGGGSGAGSRGRDSAGQSASGQSASGQSASGQSASGGMPSGRPSMGASQPGQQRSGIVVGQHRGSAPNPAAPGAGTYATGTGGTTHLMQSSGGQPSGPSPRSRGDSMSAAVVSRTSEPLGNRTFLFGVAFLLVGGIALGSQWLWPRRAEPPVVQTDVPQPGTPGGKVVALLDDRTGRGGQDSDARTIEENRQREADRIAREREAAEAARKQAEAEARAAEEARQKAAAEQRERDRIAAEARAAEEARQKAAAEQRERDRIAAEARAAEIARQKELAEQRERELLEKRRLELAEAARREEERKRAQAEAKRQKAEAEQRERELIEKRRRELAEAARREEERKTAEAAEKARQDKLAAEAKAKEEAERRERELAAAASAKRADQGTTAEIGATSTNDLAGRRIAALTPDASERSKYLKDMQAALKQGNCYSGELTGDAEATRTALATFESGYRGEARKIDIAHASSSEFEQWLSWFRRLEGVSCSAPLPVRAPDADGDDAAPSALKRYRRYRPAAPSVRRKIERPSAPVVRRRPPPTRHVAPPKRTRSVRQERSYRPSKPAYQPRPSYRASAPSYRSSGGGGGSGNLLRGER